MRVSFEEVELEFKVARLFHHLSENQGELSSVLFLLL